MFRLFVTDVIMLSLLGSAVSQQRTPSAPNDYKPFVPFCGSR